MNWEIKIILKVLMTKISHISWGGYDKGGYDKGGYDKGGYDKGFYGNNKHQLYVLMSYDNISLIFFCT